ncbi:hypothetical protein AMTRI_Chr01g130510 [Amborella trichopoda]
MYDGALTSVRTTSRETREFSVTIGLHQGSALNPYLFVLVMDDLTKHLQDEVSWCMLFADDIVLIDEARNDINTKLELWRDALESKGFKISRTKIEYMECEFNNNRSRDEEVANLTTRKYKNERTFDILGR